MTTPNLPDFQDIVDTFVTTSVPSADSNTMHATAASDLQNLADLAVDASDFRTAAELREAAEWEAYQAGDSSMLHGSDSIDLTTAADSLSDAQWYADRQAEAIAAGDYQAAQEFAESAASSLENAAFHASGDDLSVQAKADQYELEQAVSQEAEAQWYVAQAESWAEVGAYDTAETYIAEAVEHQETADLHASSALHESPALMPDPSETIESYSTTDYSISTELSSLDMSTSLDTASFDTSSWDSSYDSSYDSSCDSYSSDY